MFIVKILKFWLICLPPLPHQVYFWPRKLGICCTLGINLFGFINIIRKTCIIILDQPAKSHPLDPSSRLNRFSYILCLRIDILMLFSSNSFLLDSSCITCMLALKFKTLETINYVLEIDDQCIYCLNQFGD